MNNEKWNEICFLLSDNVRSDISESDFEQQVVQALRVLDWKEYLGDIEIRPSFQVGSVNKITPDFVIKSADNRKLFVIEIKQPNIPLNSRFQQQLFSYMRQLKLEYGILIGQAIQIFYDGNLAKQDDPILLETIKFTKDNEKGVKFVELFSKANFNQDSLREFTLNGLKKLNRREEHKELTKKLLDESYQEKLSELIKQDFLDEYDGELIESVLENLKVEIKAKNTLPTQSELPKREIYKTRIVDYSNGILPIELNPPTESEFKRRLLNTKTAYITTFYKNGTSKQKVWNAHRFRETSGVLGNLRSRPEFRNGKWQKLGIEKVYVSIEK
ncbi:type I restriction enzyme HsdR N-terminal domain-containing protein [Winogradskyella vincentii]|uniref:Type I restriction enzyme HsdR N-terminal domain-containing protein n=1 Tax=Winogradskyella vincentii TaxID=2877122 RepID=A0ABS7Y3L7_9FLAO|nr:type I restriction enzyme HsdR N-terminal domain-containing protein [Winogradskyella vincentii]MCA0154518.1 type I restriction enzyme HsdR N-terminal domain-containing protein [Winogradskyella vincentii]